MRLRQNYNHEAPRLASQIGCYAHAKQYKRMRRALRTLRCKHQNSTVAAAVDGSAERRYRMGSITYRPPSTPRTTVLFACLLPKCHWFPFFA